LVQERAGVLRRQRGFDRGRSIERQAEIMKLRKRCLPLAAVFGAAVAVVPAIATAGSVPTVNGLSYPIAWSPPEVTVAPGLTVVFRNASGIRHGIIWEKGDPATPSCESGVPVGVGNSSSSWSGACTFSKEGVYSFYCSYHGPSMSGRVIVGAGGTTTTTTTTTTTPTTTTPTTTVPTKTTPTTTTPTTTTSTQPYGGGTGTGGSKSTAPGSTETKMPPSSGAEGLVVVLARPSSRHAGAVRGTVSIPAADAGARLEVLLLARRASLARVKRSSGVRVGRFVRSSAPAGRVSFTVSLDARARRALRRRRALTLTVEIVLTPPHGARVILARPLLLRS
jgi:plastocyanin